eukprot:jgi/Chlat1/7021/Chrsp56S06702
MPASSATMRSSSLLHRLASGLVDLAPAVPINADRVEVLRRPAKFFAALMDGISSARSRIVLASLYVGTTAMEQNLVAHLAATAAARPNLNVTMLLDAQRAMRPAKDVFGTSVTAASLLAANLLSPPRKPPRARVALYRTPALRGLWKAILPPKYNEGMGVSHLKVYIFDDNVLVSGANLSSIYFTNRQDRYFLVRDAPELADRWADLIDTVAAHSYELQADGSVVLPAGTPDPESQEFQPSLASSVNKLIRPQEPSTHSLPQGCDTWAYPTVQMGSVVDVASAYFNLAPPYEAALLQAGSVCESLRVLTAAPEANGFAGAKGIPGLVPPAYSLFEQRFFEKAGRDPALSRVRIMEWARPGWTFHAKGIWCTLPGEELPSMTAIGSPNFGYRSLERDLENQLLVFTRNEGLRRRLAEERAWLHEDAEVVTAANFLHPGRRPLDNIPAALGAFLLKRWL